MIAASGDTLLYEFVMHLWVYEPKTKVVNCLTFVRYFWIWNRPWFWLVITYIINFVRNEWNHSNINNIAIDLKMTPMGKLMKVVNHSAIQNRCSLKRVSIESKSALKLNSSRWLFDDIKPMTSTKIRLINAFTA